LLQGQVTNFLFQDQVTEWLFWDQVTDWLFWDQVTDWLFWDQVTDWLFWDQVTDHLFWDQVTNYLFQDQLVPGASMLSPRRHAHMTSHMGVSNNHAFLKLLYLLKLLISSKSELRALFCFEHQINYAAEQMDLSQIGSAGQGENHIGVCFPNLHSSYK
jgi:hypothetical protein